MVTNSTIKQDRSMAPITKGHNKQFHNKSNSFCNTKDTNGQTNRLIVYLCVTHNMITNHQKYKLHQTEQSNGLSHHGTQSQDEHGDNEEHQVVTVNLHQIVHAWHLGLKQRRPSQTTLSPSLSHPPPTPSLYFSMHFYSLLHWHILQTMLCIYTR